MSAYPYNFFIGIIIKRFYIIMRNAVTSFLWAIPFEFACAAVVIIQSAAFGSYPQIAVFILNGASYSAAPVANKAFAAKIPVLSGLGTVGQVIFSYGFLVYAAIVLAVAMHWFLTRTRAGLNLRAVGENPATADAAGINVTLYKYLSTCIGAGICGIGGLYYVLDYNQGIWATTGQIEALGWLAVALVIFTTWKPLNAIWGAYLFGMLYWLYQFLPSLLGITLASYMTDLVQMLPYVVTIVVLIVVSMRKKKENQPPAHLGLAYFREER